MFEKERNVQWERKQQHQTLRTSVCESVYCCCIIVCKEKHRISHFLIA